MFSSAHKGFTLIELLVVIAIIAILSVVGIAAFKGVTGGARDSARRADIDAIAKAYEINKTSGYIALSDSQFASGKKPQDPNSQKGDYFNWLATDGSGFKVCASLDDNPNNVCNTPAFNCYCKFSSQGSLNPSSPVNQGASTNYTFGLGGSSQQSCDPNGTLLSGLVGYWKMDESSGVLADSSGNGNTGTWYGTGSSHYTAGKFGNGGGFNGINDYISTVSNVLFTNEFTISGWFYVPSWKNTGLPDQDMELILSKWRRVSNIDYGVYFGRSYGGASFLIIVSSGTDMNGNSASIPIGSVSVGAWHYIAATFKGSSFLRLYLDGGNPVSEQTSGVYSSVSNPVGVVPLVIGIHNDGYGLFAGQIDDLRIYNRALSSQEISSLWNSGNGCI